MLMQGLPPDLLLERADQALHAAKGAGRDPVIGWHAALQTGTDYKP